MFVHKSINLYPHSLKFVYIFSFSASIPFHQAWQPVPTHVRHVRHPEIRYFVHRLELGPVESVLPLLARLDGGIFHLFEAVLVPDDRVDVRGPCCIVREPPAFLLVILLRSFCKQNRLQAYNIINATARDTRVTIVICTKESLCCSRVCVRCSLAALN